MAGRYVRARSAWILIAAIAIGSRAAAAQGVSYSPANGRHGVNPDTHLVITVPTPPAIGNAGKIRIFDAADDRLADTLDLAIPPGPGEGPGALAGRVPYTPESAPGPSHSLAVCPIRRCRTHTHRAA